MKSDPSENYWSRDIKEVFDLLSTSRSGLPQHEAKKRQVVYGTNVIRNDNKNVLMKLLFAQFQSPLIVLLMVAGGVTLHLGEIIESVVIFSSVLLNVLLGLYQEYKAESIIEKLATLMRTTVRVVRGGSVREVDTSELVPGDIISIAYGARVPADARIIECTNLKVDESILTGESLPADKYARAVFSSGVSDRGNYIFSGTYISAGLGLAVVVATGMNTEIGHIAKAVSSAKRVPTPVQTAVNQMSWYIFSLAIVVVTILFWLGLYRGENVFDMLVLSVAVAVGSVPESLPIALTVILSVGVLAISRKGGLVRKLAAAETLGSTTLILTDKTGTLTRAELALDSVYSASDMLSEMVASQDSVHRSSNEVELIQYASRNLQGAIEKPSDDESTWIYLGSPFDRAFMKSMVQMGIADAVHSGAEMVLPFNSTNKYSISIYNQELTVLGAPDILIRNSTLTQSEQDTCIRNISKLSDEGKRLIAIGVKEVDSQNGSDIKGLRLLGVFGFSDTLRLDVRECIQRITGQGVGVKIVTGDLPGTAIHVARQVGLSVEADEVITGDKLRYMSDSDLIALLPTIQIFARVTPEDKLRIGRLYQEFGEIVAMTGDGVNDAPALKAMNIGISLAAGSDIAKSASDIVLIDNSFKTIVDTITEGHKIRARIQRVFVYLMSSSLDEVFVVAGALVFALPLPLTALQIIWVNILTGTLPGLAFTYEESGHSHRPAKSIFDNRVKFLALWIGGFTSLLLFGLYYYLVSSFVDIALVRSIFFSCFALYALAISYSFRNLRKSIFSHNPFSNWRLNSANSIGVLLVCATIYTPALQKVFGLVAVPLGYTWIPIVWVMLNIVIVEFAKWGFGRFHFRE